MGSTTAEAHFGRGERRLDPLGFVLRGRVVGVYLGRLQVFVAHPLLQRPRRDSLRSHPRAEGVAQIVKADLVEILRSDVEGERRGRAEAV
jgi:hypothetical protein